MVGKTVFAFDRDDTSSTVDVLNYKKAFQSNAYSPLSGSLRFIVNKFEHVGRWGEDVKSGSKFDKIEYVQGRGHGLWGPGLWTEWQTDTHD